MIRKVVMPAAGQTTDVATVTKINVSVGDSVKKGDILLEVETDKAVLPIESFAKGFVTEIFVNEFDKVDAGSPLLSIGDKDDLEKATSSAWLRKLLRKRSSKKSTKKMKKKTISDPSCPKRGPKPPLCLPLCKPRLRLLIHR